MTSGMKMRCAGLAVFCVLVMGILAGCGGPAPVTPKASYRIAVVPKGTMYEYWKSIHAGVIKAQQEAEANGIHVEVLWQGPLQEDDSASQISKVNDFIKDGVSGIVLAPNEAGALTDVVEEAGKKNIPVVIIDSDIKTDNFKSFVATDNRKAGELGGDALAKLLGGKGRVIMLRYAQGSASTDKREEGFLAAMKEWPGIQIVSSDEYAGATSDLAKKNAAALLAKLKKADGTLAFDGVYCPNESTTYGMLRALEDLKATGQVKFVGFDASQALVTALKAGEIDGLVLQDPLSIGYLGVKTMVDVLSGQKVGKRIDTGVVVATKNNMDTPEIHELLYPPLDKYLK